MKLIFFVIVEISILAILELSIFCRALRCPLVVSHRLPDNFWKLRLINLSLILLTHTDELQSAQPDRDPHQPPGCRTPKASHHGGVREPRSNTFSPDQRAQVRRAHSPWRPAWSPAVGSQDFHPLWGCTTSVDPTDLDRLTAGWSADRTAWIGSPWPSA